MAYFHTTVLDNQIKALPTVDTSSGSIATFDTDMTENLIEVKCQIVAQQGGSGTPSPSNPRPITTYTSLNLSHSGADTSNPNVTNIPFGQTVANGVLDVTTGKLRVTHGVVDMGTINFAYYQSTAKFAYVSMPTYKNASVLLCSQYPQITRSQIGYHEPYDDTVKGVGMDGQYLFIKDVDRVTTTGQQALLSGVQLVYELATPIEIQLDSITLQALLNENNIWCDTGDTEVKYLLTVGKKIN